MCFLIIGLKLGKFLSHGTRNSSRSVLRHGGYWKWYKHFELHFQLVMLPASLLLHSLSRHVSPRYGVSSAYG
jgi:hypothetical protein